MGWGGYTPSHARSVWGGVGTLRHTLGQGGVGWGTLRHTLGQGGVGYTPSHARSEVGWGTLRHTLGQGGVGTLRHSLGQ